MGERSVEVDTLEKGVDFNRRRGGRGTGTLTDGIKTLKRESISMEVWAAERRVRLGCLQVV